jgi:hypothetical protein
MTIKRIIMAALIATVLVGSVQSQPLYPSGIYLEQGGTKMVFPSGAELEVRSGATIDIQSGATTDYSGGVDLDGALLDLDANGNTSIQADTDDQIDIEISGADDFQFTANTFTALSGSTIKANTIAETTAASGVTIDSVLIKDGGVDMTAGDLVMQNDETLSNSYNGWITATVAATGMFNVATGNLKVGDGTATGTLNGEDAYIEGFLEVDGAVDADSTLDVAGTMTAAGIVSIGTFLRMPRAAAIEVTYNSTITPTGSMQRLAATGGSCSTATFSTSNDGDYVCLIGPAANTITLTDTGTLMLNANRALSAYDILCLYGDGTNWIETSFTDN